MNAAGEPVTLLSGDLTLEGRLHLPVSATDAGRPAGGTPAVAVCHPHPLYGGDMNNGVVVTICRALGESGVAALRFNFRGTGGSEGTHSGGTGEADDVGAALDYLESCGYGRLALAGYSFGAGVALAANDSRVAAVAAVSLPVVLPGKDRPEPPAGDCPLLLITGSRDDIAPAEGVRAFAAPLGTRCRVEIIDGADHFWWRREAELAATVVGFLREALAPELG